MALFEKVGYKFDAWQAVAWFRKTFKDKLYIIRLLLSYTVIIKGGTSLQRYD